MSSNKQEHIDKIFEEADIFQSVQGTDKIAILMVHFGTTHNDTRERTIDVINEKVKAEFPETAVFDAYTSRIVLKRLKDRGDFKKNPTQTIQCLHEEGYTHLLIQPTIITDALEMESIKREVENLSPLFKEIRLGDPLLYSPEDYRKTIQALAENEDKETAYIWVGHGTYNSATAQYAMLDYILKQEGYKNYFVGTIEGYPDFDAVLSLLKESNLKKLCLVPFMFVAGEHAKNDIAEDWKESLEEEGYEVEVRMEGLGQIKGIQDLYVEHLKFASKNRRLGIMKKKAIYKLTGERM